MRINDLNRVFRIQTGNIPAYETEDDKNVTMGAVLSPNVLGAGVPSTP